MAWLSWGKSFYRLYRLDRFDIGVRRMLWQSLCRTRFIVMSAQRNDDASRLV